MTVERRTFYRNFVAFATARPPWTVFVLFLGVFAFGFFLLGYYVHNNNILDSEATREWSNLYSNLTSLVFCLNHTDAERQPDMQTVSFGYQDFEMVNISLPVQLIARPYQESVAFNASNLEGLIPNLYFKYGDETLHETKFWITFQEKGRCILNENAEMPICREMSYSACITVSLPEVILPLIKPPSCNATAESSFVRNIHVAGMKNDVSQAKNCRKDELKITLAKHNDYSSEVLLSMSEKTQLNLKLQLASYFLFVIFLSFVLFAALKGRPLKL